MTLICLLQVKQITTAHTFSSTDPQHYPQRRRVLHTSHEGGKLQLIAIKDKKGYIVLCYRALQTLIQHERTACLHSS